MYAKLFASLYNGTLRGRPDEILVFTNLLAHTSKDGVVDKHPRAIAEETGISLERVNAAIATLEAPDAESRSPEADGARIVRMDEHRVWGWRVVNHAKYRAIRSEEDRAEQNRLAQARWRERNADSKQSKPSVSGVSPCRDRVSKHEAIEHIAAAPRVRAKFEPPTLESVQLQAAKIGLPPAEAEKFFNYYTANGWRVGRNPMKSWPHALANWKNNATGYAPQSAASNADRVLWSRERQAITERLKAIKQQASQSADGTVFLSDNQKAERKRLKERDAELMQKLGQSI